MRQIQDLPRIILLLVLAFWMCQATPASAYTQDEVSQLVGPVALYPDSLLSNVLAAATYPDEITQAQQWVQQYGALQPGQVDSALASVNWDPSVKSLTAIPDVLNYMAANLAWTAALGNAFLAQPDDVYAAIQNLRLAAQQNGALQSNAQVLVTSDNGAIVITSADPQYLYVPFYDPYTVYYQNWSPIYYGPGISIGQYLWLGVFDWRYRHLYFGRGYNYYYRGQLPISNPYYQRIYANVSNHAGAWQFNQMHRRGRPVPTVSQLNQGRGFATPTTGFPATAARPAGSGNPSRPNTPGFTPSHPVSPGRPANPGQTVRPGQPLTPGHQGTPALNPGRPATPTFIAPRPATPPASVPNLYNVQSGGTVNIERGQGAQSRNVNVPAPVRAVAPPTFSRPSFQPSVPMPHAAPAPRAQQAPRSQPQRSGNRR